MTDFDPDAAGVDIDCYLYPDWTPRIRPASSRRAWMDETTDAFAYRCLPLAIANAHGWEIENKVGFAARWRGGVSVDDVEIALDTGEAGIEAPVSLFGHGTLTFHIAGLFRTPPGWNLWVSGSPNSAKDGVAPLSGVIETDWSPYSFTMNWRFTRPNHWVRFEAGEPICFFFPVQRQVLANATPAFRPIGDAPELKQAFEAWSRSRDQFHAKMRDAPPAATADRWQKLYYRGVNPDGTPGCPDHEAKIRARPFANAPAEQSMAREPVRSLPDNGPEPETQSDRLLAKRNWSAQVQQALAMLSPAYASLDRYQILDPETFLEFNYAANRPAIIQDAIATWPAIGKWTPSYLAERIGAEPVEFQGSRSSNARYELDKEQHRRTMPFNAFIQHATAPDAANDVYLTAFNSAANRASLAPLEQDLGRLDAVLAPHDRKNDVMLWIGGAGTFTPLHHDLTNNLLVQITGRKRIILVPALETPKIPNSVHVFSDATDLLDPAARERYPLLAAVTYFDITLNPGEALFIPIGWWHQVSALDFSVSATYTNFRWPNDWFRGFPASA